MKTYYTPEWLAIVLCFAMMIPPILIASFVQKNIYNKHKTIVLWSILAFYAAYFVYVFLAESAGLFQAVMLPPKILLLTTMPYAILLFGVVYHLKITKSIFEQSKLSDLVQLHAFRLIGGVFIILALYDALPKTFAMIAGLGDIITAISSFFVVKALKNNKKYAQKLTFIWNTFGLIDILTTAILANVLTKISIDTGVMGVDTLANFPFCLIPAFAPPTIIFLHLLIYKKLKNFS